MVFHPTSPVRVFAEKEVIFHQIHTTPKGSAISDEDENNMSPADMSGSVSSASGWRGRLMPRRQSQDKKARPKEISRWSKTTTESELSEAELEPVSKRRSFLKKKQNPRKNSKEVDNNSPTDPFYDPVMKQLQPYGGDTPPIITASRPDDTEDPQTFLDDASDDGTLDSPTSPVIQRASSVRVSRPQVIRHSNSSAASVPKLCPPQNTPFSVHDTSSLSKPPQTLGEDLGNRLTPAVEGDEKDNSPGGPIDALRALEGNDTNGTDGDITALPQIPGQSSLEPRDSLRETIVSWPDTPSRLEALDTMPTPMGGFGSMRIPRASNGTFSTDSSATYVSPSSIIIDGLRSNPPTETDKKLSRAISAPVRNSRRVMIRPADLVINKAGHDHKLFRENIVSTPYPVRKSSHVEIDGILAASASQSPQKEGNKGKRTSKLRRSRPLSHTAERSEPDDETADIADPLDTTSTGSPNEKAPRIPFSTKPTPLQSATVANTAQSDRFPSPSAPEILFIELGLARHPCTRVAVEIEVTDKATFDDEQLSTAMRDHYINRLIGKARLWFCARTIEDASLDWGRDLDDSTTWGSTSPRTSGLWHTHHNAGFVHGGGANREFDPADFVRHLRTPRLGRRRKVWLLWLRSAQQHEYTAGTGSCRGRRSYLPKPAPISHGFSNSTSTNHSPQDEKSTSPVFSFTHSRQNSAANQPQPQPQHLHIHLDQQADKSPTQEYRGVVSKQPSLSIGRMPFTSPPTNPQPQTPSFPTSFNRSRTLAMSSSYFHGPLLPPSISLHHRFSIPAVALFTCLVLFLAFVTTVLWILFGYPGSSATQGNGVTTISGQDFDVPWRRDAQARVGVGLVMGVMVLLVGAVLEGGWIWASRVLV
ncbi:hypothetical protein G647_02084 [Cladophialophora carrionii CBS 160.54]|uniref:Uncharacterized protein n=1 Tax=Cladophialophora carrionii CBS 160.54 TaxID=1279043 RepID=V9DH81_9EURO|nr:uncharacterized protein G647_02084 [Cladophialophora carrionii CBS 160.54]ETI25312.1 hypothetical protein G647_02084 [Cladophialophora carrionii CBS 160.54]